MSQESELDNCLCYESCKTRSKLLDQQASAWFGGSGLFEETLLNWRCRINETDRSSRILLVNVENWFSLLGSWTSVGEDCPSINTSSFTGLFQYVVASDNVFLIKIIQLLTEVEVEALEMIASPSLPSSQG